MANGFKKLSSGDLIYSIDGMSIRDLKWATKGYVPALARMAAEKLYELGEKDFAVNALIEQMNLYKNPQTPENIKRESCPQAAKVLGKLKDSRAIEPLFEVLAELGYGAAYGLAEINGTEVEKRLLSLAESAEKEGVYAAVALGKMKNQTIVPKLIYILEHSEDYEKNIMDRWIPFIRMYILRILGSYKDNKVAEEAFKSNVSKHDIGNILSNYLHQDNYPDQRELEWEIVMKYGWQRFIVNEEKKFAFRYIFIDQWKNYSNAPCPFKSQADIEPFREKILDQIWSETIKAETT